jgi:alkylation response protein AidB-like acyl-CoA dehydrogenase
MHRGWAAPGWPTEYGGAGFTPTQRYLFYRACYETVPDYLEPCAIREVGPVLMRYGCDVQRRRFLPPMREFQERWCFGIAESDAGFDWARFQPMATARDGMWRLQGSKVWVAEAADAHWLCCLARVVDPADTYALFLVDMSQAGVHLTVSRTLDGCAVHAVALDGVVVPADRVAGLDADASQIVELVRGQLGSIAGRSGAAAAQLQVLDTQLGDLDPQDPLRQVRAEVDIELLALQALESRYVAALSSAAPLPFPAAALRLRAAELEAKIGTLLVESFGYYALPYPDDMLTHNEGPVGPTSQHGARAATQRMLARQVRLAYEDTAVRVRDEIADAVVGRCE